jgi:hypothetical protein
MDKLDDVTRILELVGAEPKPWATLVEAIMRAPPSDAMLRVSRRRGGGMRFVERECVRNGE